MTQQSNTVARKFQTSGDALSFLRRNKIKTKQDLLTYYTEKDTNHSECDILFLMTTLIQHHNLMAKLNLQGSQSHKRPISVTESNNDRNKMQKSDKDGMKHCEVSTVLTDKSSASNDASYPTKNTSDHICNSDHTQKLEKVPFLNVKKVATSSSDATEGKEDLIQRLELAEMKLLSGYIPEEPVGRETELQQVLDFISNAMKENQGNSMHICGAPGRGKTFVIQVALKKFAEIISAPSCSNGHAFDSIWLTGTNMNGSDFHKDLVDKLNLRTGGSLTSQAAHDLLTSRFLPESSTTIKPPKNPSNFSQRFTILVIDEIDKAPVAATRELLTIAKLPNSTLILIGLSNIVLPKVLYVSRMPQVLVFPQYTCDALERIIVDRAPEVFDSNALRFLVSKANVSGDVRPMLQVATRCVATTVERIRASTEDFQTITKKVTLKVVMDIYRQANPDPIQQMVSRIIGLSVRERLLLVALVLADHGSDIVMNRNEMTRALASYCEQKSIPNKNSMEVFRMAENLYDAGMLLPAYPYRKLQQQRGPNQDEYRVRVTADIMLQCGESLERMHLPDLTRLSKIMQHKK